MKSTFSLYTEFDFYFLHLSFLETLLFCSWKAYIPSGLYGYSTFLEEIIKRLQGATKMDEKEKILAISDDDLRPD